MRASGFPTALRPDTVIPSFDEMSLFSTGSFVSKALVSIVAVCCISIGFLAGRFSTTSVVPKATAPFVASKPDSQKYDSSVPLNFSAGNGISFEDAAIDQRGPTAANSFVSFTLRGKWTNKSPAPVTIFYDVHFYDGSGIELYSSGRFRDVDANAATAAPQVIATLQGKASDDFDYRAVKSVIVKFAAKGSNAEKIVVSNVPIRRTE